MSDESKVENYIEDAEPRFKNRVDNVHTTQTQHTWVNQIGQSLIKSVVITVGGHIIYCDNDTSRNKIS